MSSRIKNSATNIVFSLVLQMITAIGGLVIPRIIIPTYGSEANGLVSSINQFLSYIALLEAGIGGVINAALYKPLSEKNMAKVSQIIKAAKLFYRKIGYIFILYILILCVLFPLFASKTFDAFYIVFMVIILSISTFLQYFFSLPYISLITSDQHVRVTYAINSITVLLNIICTFVLVQLGLGLHIVKLFAAAVFSLKPIFYYLYVKKHYKLDRKCSPDNKAIKQRWNGMLHHISFFIHTNTDIAVLTIFTDLKIVSVYAVYQSIVVGIRTVILSVSNGAAASIGNLLVTENKQKANDVIDKLEFIQGGITTILFTITAILIIPFVKLFTVSMDDANYIRPLFAYILIMSEAMYCIRAIYSTVSMGANRYKETQNGALLECIANIVISVILVQFVGLEGVAIGTFVAMFLRCVFEVWYLSKHLLYRKIVKFIKLIFVNGCVAFSSVMLSALFSFIIKTWGAWIISAFVYSMLTGIIAIVIYYVFYKKEILWILSLMKQMLKKVYKNAG